MNRTPIANLKGPRGARGDRGLPGLNGVPTDAAVAAYAETDGTDINTAIRGVVDAAGYGDASRQELLRVAERPPVPTPGPKRGVLFPGAAGVFISAPGSAFNVATDIDIRILVTLADWSPSSGMTFVSRGDDTGGSQFKFEINATGQLIFRWSPTGTSTFVTKGSLVSLATLPANAALWLRVAFDADNGNGESEIFFYTSSDGERWAQMGASVKTTGVGDFVTSSDALRVGGYAPAGALPLTGTVHEVVVSDGIDGPALGHWKAGTLPYKDEQGNTWSATGAGLSLVERPAASLTMLPGRANNVWQYNATSYAGNLTEWGGYQFVAWWGADRYLRIARRAIGSQHWDAVHSWQGGVGSLASQVAADGHNVIAIHADRDGFLHLAANMHGDWLKYAKSTTPGDVTSWVYPGMIRGTGALTGTDEGLVTYPRFLTNPANGDLYFFYRNGGSGNGDSYLNRYDASSTSWVRVGKILDGTATSESAYENTVLFDDAGVLHLSFTWAASGSGFNDRTDVCYMKSSDGGSTWRNVSNTAVSVPVTHVTAPVVLPAAPGSGLLNQTGMCVDAAGRPHIAHFWAPDGNRNIWHLYYDGVTWQHEQITTFKTSGLAWTGLSRPAIVFAAGRLLVIWRHQYEGWEGKVWATDITVPGQPVHSVLLEADLREWEPAPDYKAVRRGSLNLLVTRVNGQLPAAIPGYERADWSKQPAGVLTIDLTAFDRRQVPRLAKDRPTDP